MNGLVTVGVQDTAILDGPLPTIFKQPLLRIVKECLDSKDWL
jgi:hypothetical protein